MLCHPQLYLALLVASTALSAQTETVFSPTRSVIYKQVGDVALHLHIFEPEATSRDVSERPAIVFFFGGGWKHGSADQFYPQAQALAAQGVVALSADYRVEDRDGVAPRVCVEDARSCLRWVRAHAAELGIDPARIAAGGGSAGGHIAASTALVESFDDPLDDLGTSCRPDALVLFNPVLDNGPDGYGYNRVKEDFPRISPAHQVSAGWPPTLIMLGSEDQLIPVATLERFREGMVAAGNSCELRIYEGGKHGFFNRGRNHDKDYRSTLRDTEIFLRQQGWITR